VALALAPAGADGVLGERDGAPLAAATGDGTMLALDGRASMSEAERIARLLPRHSHEIADAFNPFEVGLAHEVHLAKGCFTGQEALQRLITYDSVRRRPARVRVGARGADIPCDILARGERAGVLTSVAAPAAESVAAGAGAAPGGLEGFAVLRVESLADRAELSLPGGARIDVVSAPEPARPIGRP
jgi:folate-binding protein YgfZ